MNNYVKITLSEASILIDFGDYQDQARVNSPVRVKRDRFLCHYIHPKGYLKAVVETMTPQLNWYFSTPSEFVMGSFPVSHINNEEITTIQDLWDRIGDFYIT